MSYFMFFVVGNSEFAKAMLINTSNSKSRRDFPHIQRRPDVNVGAIRTKPAKAD